MIPPLSLRMPVIAGVEPNYERAAALGVEYKVTPAEVRAKRHVMFRRANSATKGFLGDDFFDAMRKRYFINTARAKW